jgi:hypothetical protein
MNSNTIAVAPEGKHAFEPYSLMSAQSAAAGRSN